MWWKLPLITALLTLVGYREILFKNNLHDSYERLVKQNFSLNCLDPVIGNLSEILCSDDDIKARTIDGTCNDLDNPSMGSVFYRFGRNVPLANATTDPNMTWPNPRTISKMLMARKKFQPAKTLNLLSASWLQFMLHDWFAHGPNEETEHISVPVSKNDTLGSCEKEKCVWKVKSTRKDPCASYTEEKDFKAFQNLVTHWWDGSQIYGSDENTNKKVRLFKDGKLKVTSNGLIPVNETTSIDITGFNDNWWTGLSLLHNLFTKEHNAICDMLKVKNSNWTDGKIFDTARLINSALMAKIHTIEWTPALMNDIKGRKTMYINWYGIMGKEAKQMSGSTGDPVKSGIPGTSKNLDGVPFSMTEEFVSVYRMHPLLPDSIDIHRLGEKVSVEQVFLTDLLFGESQKLWKRYKFEDLLYTFGIVNPGALTLKNYPNSLRDIKLPNGDHIDLASLDIIRDRERGIPRYNQFRQLLGKAPVSSFSEITPDETLAKMLRKVYEDDINAVDLLTGTLAENPRPSNWAFSDTVFRDFIAMASRRLMADRFYTDNYNEQYYTKEGLAWIDDNDMKSVLIRAFPLLKSVLYRVGNTFFPWNDQAEWQLEDEDFKPMSGSQNYATHDASIIGGIITIIVILLFVAIVYGTYKLKRSYRDPEKIDLLGNATIEKKE